MSGIVPREVVLIDLSSIAYPIWHMSQSDPDPNKTSTQTVARIRALTSGKPHAAICCDSGRSFRADITPTYKANRPQQDGTLKHQISLACEQLRSDGFPVWSVKGFEADDLVASAVARALETPDLSVLIVTADKDLLQLVGPRVRAMSARDGSVLDQAGVGSKLGVLPAQMRDYLTLVGDTSDNITGAKGIGPKKAADLLAKFTSLDELYAQLETRGGASIGLPPALSLTLREFKSSGALDVARALVTLRTDVDVPFAEIDQERIPKEAAAFGVEFDVDADGGDLEADAPPAPAAPVTAPVVTAAPEQAPQVAPDPAPVWTTATSVPTNTASQPAAPTSASAAASAPATALALREPDQEILPAAPAEWERQLDPRSMRDARILAKDMHDSRLFSAYGTPQGVLSTVMLGRELGMPAMASLRGIHIIEGRHALAAGTMVALILKSGMAEYFDPIEFDAVHAIFETKRKGARKAIQVAHTIEMATTAGLVKPNSNWVKVPTDMLVARAQSRLARLVYPDIVGGLYTPDELAELREQAVA